MKLDHRWSRRRISEYIDGDLSPSERRRLERHTDICPECRRALRTLIALVLELRRLRGAARPSVASVASRVLERLARDANGGSGIRSGR